jgi:3-hydroxyacyl-CoA dehydrogenase
MKIIKEFSKITKFGVIGSGQMGTGIGLVASLHANLEVKIIDNNISKLE